MKADIQTAIRRLELAISFLSEYGKDDWYQAYFKAMDVVPDGCEDDWAAADLIVIAVHGAPDNIEYKDLESFGELLANYESRTEKEADQN